MTTEITNKIIESHKKLHQWINGDQPTSYSEIGSLKYELNQTLSDLHSIINNLPLQQFYKLKNALVSLIELCNDIRKDLGDRAHRIEQAIIQISKEKYNGELWREVLQLARDMKNNTEL